MPQSYEIFPNLPNIFEAKLQTQEMGLPFMLKKTESRDPNRLSNSRPFKKNQKTFGLLFTYS